MKRDRGQIRAKVEKESMSFCSVWTDWHTLLHYFGPNLTLSKHKVCGWHYWSKKPVCFFGAGRLPQPTVFMQFGAKFWEEWCFDYHFLSKLFGWNKLSVNQSFSLSSIMLKMWISFQPIFNFIFLGRATGEEVLQTSKTSTLWASYLAVPSLSLSAGAGETDADSRNFFWLIQNQK